MLRSRIIPCLLMHDGGLVKTEKFKEGKYIGDPLNAVKIFNEKAVDELMLLDIDATVTGRGPDYSRLRSIAVESRMPLCYGGGVSSAEQAAKIISLGFEKVSISAAALERPLLIGEMAEAIGSQSVVVTLDVKRNTLMPGYTIYTNNGRTKRKENLIEFCERAVQAGAGEIVINSIDRDGTMAGYDLDLAKKIRSAVSSPLSFVGGAGCLDHMQALIDAVGVVGAGAGSMFVFKGTYRAVLINYDRPSRLT
jgi:imidazole glycerol-phosphate synthase subunit HisF